jgi:acylphosphatase
MTDVGVHIVVKGLVQGVGFRYFVYQRGQRLRIAGLVRNLADGSVEIEAEGPRPLLEQLIAEVSAGPRAARVSDVAVSWRLARRHMTEFTIQ